MHSLIHAWPAWLPRGGSLPEAMWRTRHRAVMALLWLHVVGIPIYALLRGVTLGHALVEMLPVLLGALAAGQSRLGPLLQSAAAALALMISSGIIVHLSDGIIEAHFHFFVMIPVVALYEAWLPFALGVWYVLVHHGVMGTLDPRSVYNHPAAWEHPVLFAGIHAGFFAAASAACIYNWWIHERARLKSEGQHRLLTEIVTSMRDGLAVIDADGQVVLRNPASVALLGALADADGDLAASTSLTHPDGSPLHRSELPHIRALAGQQVADVDLVVRRDADDAAHAADADADADADTVLSFSATALDGGRDAARQVVVVCRDVTERHRTEQALATTLATEQRAVAKLRAVEKVKDEFVSTVSHELRTPITSIMGFLELLEDGVAGDLTTPQTQIVDRIDRNGRRLLALVEDLLTHSRIESSALTMDCVPTDLRQVVWSARDAVAGLLATRILDVRLEVPAAAVDLQADPVELERALVNLLSNAIKFTPDGGTVSVRLSGDSAGVTLVVTDTGWGIPEDEQAHLFTRFFRSSTSTHHAVQGTGLGLVIVHGIVSLHGGSIDVDSSSGQGSTFTIRLPRAVSPDAPGAGDATPDRRASISALVSG